MTLLVRDEEDILESTIRFHLSRGVDLIVATDNNSVDGSFDILREYEKAGVVRALREADDTYSQGRWVTRMAQMACAEHGADWVIHGDADEFWWPKEGTLKTSLEAIPAQHGIVLAPRVNFLPMRVLHRPFYEEMIVRETRSYNLFGRPLPPKVCHRAVPDAIVAQGNHTVHQTSLTQLPGIAPIVILHFPLRSFEQFENKVVKGGQAYERNRELPPEVGRTWRTLYQIYCNGGLRSYYESQLRSPSDIRAGIREGKLIVDRRVAAFFADA